MIEAVRIDVQEARAKMISPNAPLLVCGYEDDKKFKMFNLEGAIPFSHASNRAAALPTPRGLRRSTRTR